MVVLEENPAGAANWAEERQPDWRRADDVKSLVCACRTGVRFRRANLASSVIEKLPWRQGRSDSVLLPREARGRDRGPRTPKTAAVASPRERPPC